MLIRWLTSKCRCLRGLDLTIHVARYAAQYVARFDTLTDFHPDGFGMHVEIAIVRPIVSLEPHGSVNGHEVDDAVRNSDSLPLVVGACRRADILALMTFAGRTERHAMIPDFAIGVAQMKRIIIARVAFGAANCPLAAPAAAAETPDLRIQECLLVLCQLEGKDNAGQPDFAVPPAASGILLCKFAGRMVAEAGAGSLCRHWLRRHGRSGGRRNGWRRRRYAGLWHDQRSTRRTARRAGAAGQMKSRGIGVSGWVDTAGEWPRQDCGRRDFPDCRRLLVSRTNGAASAI